MHSDVRQYWAKGDPGNSMQTSWFLRSGLQQRVIQKVLSEKWDKRENSAQQVILSEYQAGSFCWDSEQLTLQTCRGLKLSGFIGSIYSVQFPEEIIIESGDGAD